MSYLAQKRQILHMLGEAYPKPVSVKQFLEKGIARYGARLYDLRQLGFVIPNRKFIDIYTQKCYSDYRFTRKDYKLYLIYKS